MSSWTCNWSHPWTAWRRRATQSSRTGSGWSASLLATDIAAVTMEVTVEADDAAGSNPESIRAAVTEQFLNTPSADPGEPRVVEAEVVQKEDTIRIRYTSSMQSQRIVTPEKLVSATIGDPDSFRVPIKVMRVAQYVARDGRLVSPIDEGVVQTTA
jgi:hypothetical protein